MSRDYAWEKLFSAVLGMVRSDRPLREKLGNAYNYHIIHIKSADLPDDEARETLAGIERLLTRKQATGNEGDVAASAAIMSDSEALNLSEKIVGLYDQMAQYGPHSLHKA